MNLKARNLTVLRAFLEKPTFARPKNELFSALGHSDADSVLGGGLRRDCLHEIFAAQAGAEAAATGFALALASRLQTKNKWLLWVRQDFSALESGEIHGCGLRALGFDPQRLVIVKVPDVANVLRAGAEGLACKGVSTVIFELRGATKTLDLLASRRLTLAAAQGVTAILLRLGAEPEPSTAETRWRINAARSNNEDLWGPPVFEASLLRNRHGSLGHWVMEWNCDARSFAEPQNGAANPVALVCAFADRPAGAQAQSFRQTG